MIDYGLESQEEEGVFEGILMGGTNCMNRTKKEENEGYDEDVRDLDLSLEVDMLVTMNDLED